MDLINILIKGLLQLSTPSLHRVLQLCHLSPVDLCCLIQLRRDISCWQADKIRQNPGLWVWSKKKKPKQNEHSVKDPQYICLYMTDLFLVFLPVQSLYSVSVTLRKKAEPCSAAFPFIRILDLQFCQYRLYPHPLVAADRSEHCFRGWGLLGCFF